MTGTIPPILDAVDSIRDDMLEAMPDIPIEHTHMFVQAYNMMTEIADRIYMDATGDRTIEEIHGGE